VILGTAAYMSPEQAKGRAADKRSDVWAFGCVVYEMLTGRRAFAGDEITETLAFVITRDPDWSLVPASTPQGVQTLVRRCLEKERKRRLADLADARIEIDDAIDAPASAAAAPAQPSRAGLSRWTRLPVVVAAAFLLGAVVTLGVAAALRPRLADVPVTRFVVPFGEGETITNTAQPMVAVSPSGSDLVYVANSRLYRRPLSEVVSQPIPGIEPVGGTAGVGPVFSPDGQSLACYYGNPTYGASGNASAAGSVRTTAALKTIPLAGGIPATICSVTPPAFGMSWGPGGIVFVDGGSTIKRVPRGGGSPETLVSARNGEILQHPQLLPGGEAVLFTVAANPGTGLATLENWDNARIVVQSIKSGERKTLIEGGAAGRYVPSGHLVYAVSGIMFAMRFDPDRLTAFGP